MILLYIYLIISGLCLIMYTLAAIAITHKFRTKYPNLKYPKTCWARRILSNIKLIITCFMPLLNIGLIWVVMFHYEKLETKTLDKLYFDCLYGG